MNRRGIAYRAAIPHAAYIYKRLETPKKDIQYLSLMASNCLLQVFLENWIYRTGQHKFLAHISLYVI